MGRMISLAKGYETGIGRKYRVEYQEYLLIFSLPLPRGKCKSLYR